MIIAVQSTDTNELIERIYKLLQLLVSVLASISQDEQLSAPMAEDISQGHFHVLTSQIKHTLVPTKYQVVMLGCHASAARNSMKDVISGHDIVLRHFLKLYKPPTQADPQWWTACYRHYRTY